MCIKVYANGDNDDSDGVSNCHTHVSVYVYLLKGEYDSKLVWPFRGAVTIQLVNHKNDQDHREHTVPFFDAVATDRGSGQMGEKSVGWGKPYFISHAKVESSTETRQFMKNDSLTFRMTNIDVYSV